MGKLLNPKWERFAQSIVSGASKEDAVAAALPGCAPDSERFKGWLKGLMGNEQSRAEIERRVAELGGPAPSALMPAAKPVPTIPGLDHLDGETVAVVAAAEAKEVDPPTPKPAKPKPAKRPAKRARAKRK